MRGPSETPARIAGDPAAEQLRLLIDGIAEYAVVTMDADGRIRTWNAGAELLTGHEAGAIEGRSASILYSPADRSAGRPDQDLAVAAAAGRFHQEAWRVRRDGRGFWADVLISPLRGADDRLLGFGMIIRDLTERHQGEELLRESERSFRLMIDSVAEYAIFMLDPEGRILSWNLGAERLKGYRAEEVIGKHFSIFYSEDDVRAGKPQDELDTAIREGRVEDESWRVRKDGSRFMADVVITALRGRDGRLQGFGKVTRDVTARVMAEDALRGVLARERATADRLRELDRMKTDLVAIVAHDLRAPLSVIAGFVDLLLTSGEQLTEELQRDYLERIARGASNLSELVDDILEVARIESGELRFEFTAVDLDAVAADAVAQVSGAEDAGRIRLEVAEGVPPAQGDGDRLGQVLVNLLSNALKFSVAPAPVMVRIRRDGGQVRVDVVDEGPGIPEAEQGRLFQRFSRLPRTAGQHVRGTGLGLYICRSFIEAMGGRIWVESTAGRGATFSFTLPVAEDDAA